MNKKLIPMVTVAFLVALMPYFVTAQSTAPTTGPDSDITIVCDVDYYSPDVFGNVDIYCDITNDGIPVKAKKVGAIFDDYLGDNVEILEVNKDGSPVTFGLTNLPPQAGHVKNRVLSNQVVTIPSGDTVQIHMKVKTPFGSSGKFDMLFGDPDLGSEYRLDPWWNVSWQFKACWNLSGHTDNFTSVDINRYPYGYPFNLTLNTQSLIGAAKMNADCSDLRVVNNETTEAAFFIRDCGETVTEVWGAWNFTLGESEDFCVYYGNSGASNAESNRHDIVYAYEDFDDHTLVWSEYINYSASQSSPNTGYATINVSGGNGELNIMCGASGNCGWGTLRNDTWDDDIQFLAEVNHWYTSPATEWFNGRPITQVQANDITHPEIWDGVSNNYVQIGASSGVKYNASELFLTYKTSAGYDIAIEGSNSTIGDRDYWADNNSNYISTNGIWTAIGWVVNYQDCSPNYENTSRNTCSYVYGDYNGQPKKDQIPIPIDHNTQWGGTELWSFEIQPSQDMYDSWGKNLTFLWYGSQGAWNTGSPLAKYDYWFVRPYYDGEPLATGGAEVPLDNGTLDISFVSPTPANGSTVGTPTVIINVSANKTIEECWLDFDGVNYSMTTDTTYCWKEQLVDGTTRDYKVFVEDLWGYTEQTGESTITGTNYAALFGVPFTVGDFNFSSSSYVTGVNVSFNSSLATTDLVLMTSMNVKKETGSAENAVSVKVIVDGVDITEQVIRTMSTVGEEGSTGIDPVAFNVSAGSHYIEIQFKRTGDGIVNVNDIDMSLGQLVTSSTGTVNGELRVGNYTFEDTNYAQVDNFSINNQKDEIFTALTVKTYANDTVLTNYATQNIENNSITSPYMGRYLATNTSIGALSIPYVTSNLVVGANMTVLSKNSVVDRETSVNYSFLWFGLEDNYSKEITNFQISNPSTNDTESISVGDTWTLLDEYNVTVEIGNGYFVAMSVSYQSTTGAQTVTHKINSTDAPCSSKKERYLADNTDVGNSYIYFICDNLTATNSYNFQLWAKAGSGETFNQFDDSFAGFETQNFDITTGNLPPFPGVITNPVNASVVDTEVNVTWTPWTDPNSNFDDYNVSLLNGDGSYNSTITGSTTNLYAVIDILGLPSGVMFGVEVNGCDTEPLCVAEVIYFEVQNIPEYSNFASDPETTNFTAEADLTNVTDPVLANSYAKVEWSGSGYDVAGADFDSYVIYGSNLASVDTTTFPTFDGPATITLKGVTYSSTVAYRVLDDGVACTTCVKLSSTPATFTVPGFSNYTTSSVPATETQPLLALIPLVIAVALVLGFVGAFISGLLDLQMMVIWIVIAAIAMTFIGVIFII